MGAGPLSLMVAPLIASRSPPPLGLDVSSFSTSERFHIPSALRTYWGAHHILFALFTEPGSIPLPAGLPSTPAPWADLLGIGPLTPPQPLTLPSPFSLASQGEYSVDPAPSVRLVIVHEMEDLILNCELSWHRLSQGLTDYSFFRVWGKDSETLLSKGKNSTLIKTAVTAEDAGVYRCSLDSVRSIPATIIFYQVKVLPGRISEELPSNISQGGQAPGQGDSTIQPTPTQCPKSENVLRGRLIGLLIWGFVVLIIGFTTAILCFRPEKVINSIKSCFDTKKEPAKQPQVPEEKATPSRPK
ncbi:izumo sperm-egg fusion protein 1 isoform X5 [Leptonychotes weddellii]|uniref:Izumo sperm-egg fusion protein 1 isoform X5 n=1 Tax=Leptonychotes weddellii TaxID=9713 RepID=A0A7F8Q1L2_LEPWE|nr:izumo sperm-egg fusion protein 1 isoform X5 [Leptonychotes weddellii]